MSTIAIIDDHELYRKSLGALLESKFGFKIVLEASDGNDFFTQLRNLKSLPSLIITDIQMSGMDGIELVKKLRCDDKKVKIIALSMYNHEHMIYSAIKCGANGFVCKGSSFENFLFVINMLLSGDKTVFTNCDDELTILDSGNINHNIELSINNVHF